MGFIHTCFRIMDPLPRIDQIFFGRSNKSPRNQNRSSFFKLSQYISQIAINGTKEIKERYGPRTEKIAVRYPKRVPLIILVTIFFRE